MREVSGRTLRTTHLDMVIVAASAAEAEQLLSGVPEARRSAVIIGSPSTLPR